jgi:type I restriction enzyme S subunit
MKNSWKEVFIGEFLRPAREPISIQDNIEYMQVTVAMHGRGVRLRQRVLGMAIKTKKQYRANAGRFIYSRIDARNGAMGIVTDNLDGAIISGDFPTFDFVQEKVNPRFFEYITKTASFEETCRAPSKGVTNRKRLKEEEFLAIRVYLPDLSEQRRLVDIIDHISVRVEEAKRLEDEIEEEQTALLLRRVEQLSEGAQRMAMCRVAPVFRRPVEIQPDTWYPELGIRSFGKGTFHKEPIKGSDLGNKRLYQIEPGDLLFSNVFSWEGAIAVVQAADKGRFGSHRFITCVPDPKRNTAEFLCHWFLCEKGLADIRAASPGAAGRNKTLGIKKLESLEVPIPTIEKQLEFSELVNKVKRVKIIHHEKVVSLDHFIPALLDQAFRGEL